MFLKLLRWRVQIAFWNEEKACKVFCVKIIDWLIVNLCLKWHILRSRFLAVVTFKEGTNTLFFIFWNMVLNVVLNLVLNSTSYYKMTELIFPQNLKTCGISSRYYWLIWLFLRIYQNYEGFFSLVILPVYDDWLSEWFLVFT